MSVAAELGMPCRPRAAQDIEGFGIGHAEQIRDHGKTACFGHLHQLIAHRRDVLKAIDL
jgi:hypothetical protein